MMQSIAETCVRFDAAHLSINLVSEIALPMFPTLMSAVDFGTQLCSIVAATINQSVEYHQEFITVRVCNCHMGSTTAISAVHRQSVWSTCTYKAV